MDLFFILLSYLHFFVIICNFIILKFYPLGLFRLESVELDAHFL